jgi:predicted CXXCH cytochrome family protein
VHAPFAGGDCTSCHNPHRSALDKLLLVKGSDACLACHKAMKEAMADRKVHAPAAEDCLKCHSPHASANPALLSRAAQQVCTQCHKPDAPAFAPAHLGIDVAKDACTSCHDPHFGRDERLLHAVVHRPFEARNCGTCHTAAPGPRRKAAR